MKPLRHAVRIKQYRSKTVHGLAKNQWPHKNIPWPNISLGTILGCGCLPAKEHNAQQPENAPKLNKGATKLLHILLSESAHLIWVLRCERVIRNKEREHRN
jgi:hypothetical protein